MEEVRLREELVQYGKRILQRGLVAGPGGNLSARLGEDMLISPSGFAFDELHPEDYVKVSLKDGKVVSGGKPSSEILMHWLIYLERRDVMVVVHTHPPFVLGVTGGGGVIQPMFPDFVAYLARTAVLDYITPCTLDLAQAVRDAIREADAVLLRNHGLVTVGLTLKEAYYRTEIMEEAARITAIGKLFGNPRILSAEECATILNLDAEKYRQELVRREL
ncbi:MAG: class II aldolase/adducin family protein [Atribacterota bacterium]|nr:class II aldolase/adducin family protein [Atribacterota bacterium]